MLKRVVIILLLIVSANANAQEELITFKNSIKVNTSSVKDIFPVVNQDNNDVSIFVVDAKHICGYLLNEKFEIKDRLISQDRRRKYKAILGYSINEGDDYRLFLSNNSKDKFASVKLSYSSDESSLKEFTLQRPNEIFLQTLSVNNKFYLITIIQNTSIFKLYSFDKDGSFLIDILDYGSLIVGNSIGESSLVYTSLKKTNNSEVKLNKIDENVPTSIELASEKSKMFIDGSKVMMTFDKNKEETYFLSFDLSFKENGFNKILKRIIKPSDFKKSNSFINDEKIFTIAATSDDMVFRVQNINSLNIIKEFKINSKDSITFKNSSIIQEGGIYDDYRELEKTSKFLRKITSSEIGIAVNMDNENYRIVLGGKKKVSTMSPGISVGSFGAVSVFFNPVNFAYNSYSNTKSTYINCLFDNNFNHVKGTFPENEFDRIKGLEGDIERNEYNFKVDNIESVFKHGSMYINCVYMPISKRIRLRKF